MPALVVGSYRGHPLYRASLDKLRPGALVNCRATQPLSGGVPAWRRHAQFSAFDPKATSTLGWCYWRALAARVLIAAPVFESPRSNSVIKAARAFGCSFVVR